MKLSYTYNEGLSKGETLLKEILDESHAFEGLDGNSVGEILQVFKIGDSGATDRAGKIAKIKQKLLDVIVDEKDQCVNYLILPKFNSLGDQARQVLKEVIATTWSSYLAREAQQQKNKKYSLLFCQGGTPKQIQQFHLSLFNMFRTMFLYQNPSAYYRMLPNYPPMTIMAPHPTSSEAFPGYSEQMAAHHHHQMYQMGMGRTGGDDIMGMGMGMGMGVHGEGQGGIKIEDKGEADDIYLKDESSKVKKRPKKKPAPDLNYQPPAPKSYNYHINHNKDHNNSHHHNNGQQNTNSYQAPTIIISNNPHNTNNNTNPHTNTGNTNKIQKQSSSHHPMTIISKAFTNCVCKGKLSESQRFFQCQQCQRKYHLACLNIPITAVQKPGVHKKCPQCYLENNNSLYMTIEELESFWSDDRELHKQKITIKAKKSKEIQQKKYSIQLRFMKIEGRTMYDWETSGQLKVQTGLIEKPNKSILNEVLLKDEVITKGNGEDVKISLDYMKGSQIKNDDRKPVLLFVALNIVQQKSVQQILQGHYQYFQDTYLDRFLKDRDQLKIQIFDINFKLIKIPVRGSDCQHSDLYDLEQFANHCVDLHNDMCFSCSKRCRTFKIDRKVEAEIKKIKETIEREEDYPQAIYYQRDGTFRWKDSSKEQTQMEQEGVNNQKKINLADGHQNIGQSSANITQNQAPKQQPVGDLQDQQFSSLQMSDIDYEAQAIPGEQNEDKNQEDGDDDDDQSGSESKKKGKNKTNGGKNGKTIKIKKKNKQ